MVQSRFRTFAAATALTLSLLATTCGDDDADEAANDPSTTTTTSTTLSPEAEVEAAYLAFWDMAVRLAQAPNPDDPEIPQRASGAALGQLIDGLTTQRTLGRAAVPGPLYAHVLLSVDVEGASATVRDCQIDDSTILDQATGQPIAGSGPATGLLEARVILEADRWKVDGLETIGTWSGATTCDG